MNRRVFIAGLGSTAALPVVAWAQQQRTAVIGALSASSSFGGPRQLDAFRRALADGGYVEGRNVEIVFQFADNQYDRLLSLAEGLVRRRVDLIVATASTAALLAAKASTGTIPIVFQLASDAVALGLVANLNRGGGNITGVMNLAQGLLAKRLELLHESVPPTSSFAFLFNASNPDAARINEAENAARTLGIDLLPLKISGPNDIETAFAMAAQRRIGALLVDADSLFFVQRAQLAALAARFAIPAIYHAREVVEAGGLMSYGADYAETFRMTGTYASRILKGEKPADLPIQQATKIELVLNLKTAQALGLTIPLSLLGRADEVIE
jgi:ABC-type uncharacterized transport system substrate-binding protein